MSVYGRVICLTAVLLMFGEAKAEIKRYVLGGSEHPWSDMASFMSKYVDYFSDPGKVMPVRVPPGENILHKLWEEGRLFPAYGVEGRVVGPYKGRIYSEGDGRLWSPHVGFGGRERILIIADGSSGEPPDSTAFDDFMKSANNLGVVIYVDLGAPYPVKRVKFWPLLYGEFQDYYLKGYELYANDGEEVDEEGKPIYHLLSAVPTNTQVVVDDSSFTPQYIRYLKLRSSRPDPFQLNQLEIYGEGYLREMTFISKVIDLGNKANLGRVWWKVEVEPGSHVAVYTRVGKDATALKYFRLNEVGEEEEILEGTDEDNRKAWERLAPDERGRKDVPDLENWTPWSPPYSSPGEPFIVEGPRRYLQIKVVVTNDSPMTKAKVDEVSFEYSQPVVARRLLGKIFPNTDVDLGEPTTFHFVVRPEIDRGRGDTGFDIVEIATPVRTDTSTVVVKVGGKELPRDDYTVEATEDTLRVRLGRLVSSNKDSLEVIFENTILVYGTTFNALAYASWMAESLPQKVEEERLGDLTVKGSMASLGRVLGDVTVFPNPFTPNKDGKNDETTITFKIFGTVRPVPVSVTVYDVSGRIVRKLWTDEVGNGEYPVSWDGKDDEGNIVPPGVYLFRVLVRGDEERFQYVGLVSVVY
ncbi:MAG: hypothetical protein DRP94_04785 [Candidatus Latescibacterota bacterium]|nr:MAG: hypothetical protein DRP94_04785 [Candidatus Latescibacterota bacterium]HDI00420.1 hypothetical protein [Bacillota bacterium]